MTVNSVAVDSQVEATTQVVKAPESNKAITYVRAENMYQMVGKISNACVKALAIFGMFLFHLTGIGALISLISIARANSINAKRLESAQNTPSVQAAAKKIQNALRKNLFFRTAATKARKEETQLELDALKKGSPVSTFDKKALAQKLSAEKEALEEKMSAEMQRSSTTHFDDKIGRPSAADKRDFAVIKARLEAEAEEQRAADLAKRAEENAKRNGATTPTSADASPIAGPAQTETVPAANDAVEVKRKGTGVSRRTAATVGIGATLFAGFAFAASKLVRR